MVAADSRLAVGYPERDEAELVQAPGGEQREKPAQPEHRVAVEGQAAAIVALAAASGTLSSTVVGTVTTKGSDASELTPFLTTVSV